MSPRLSGAAALAVAAFLHACGTPAFAQTGVASWYGPSFHGRLTASGERFDQHAATCAHRKHAFGTILRVVNLRNGKAATCRVNDRGPFAGGRVIDVSKGVAASLGMIRAGTARVEITVIR